LRFNFEPIFIARFVFDLLIAVRKIDLEISTEKSVCMYASCGKHVGYITMQRQP